MVVDPTAGGGTTFDVCESIGRRCLAYDLHSVRPKIRLHDVNNELPSEAHGCDLVFRDPPYHTMLARRHGADGFANVPLSGRVAFLERLAANCDRALRPGGHVALLVANQTEKNLPAGHRYLDHAVLGYQALVASGFMPDRRVSCPMDGADLPQACEESARRRPNARPGPRPFDHPKAINLNDLRQGFAAGQLVDLAPYEGV